MLKIKHTQLTWYFSFILLKWYHSWNETWVSVFFIIKLRIVFPNTNIIAVAVYLFNDIGSSFARTLAKILQRHTVNWFVGIKSFYMFHLFYDYQPYQDIYSHRKLHSKEKLSCLGLAWCKLFSGISFLSSLHVCMISQTGLFQRNVNWPVLCMGVRGGW